MIAGNLPDTPSQKGRAYLFTPVQHELFPAAVLIRAGKGREVYAVDEWESFVSPDGEFCRRFVLVKCSAPKKGEAGIYVVTVECGLYFDRFNAARGPRVGRCSCCGFGRWKSCKHADALSAIVGAGLAPLTSSEATF